MKQFRIHYALLTEPFVRLILACLVISFGSTVASAQEKVQVVEKQVDRIIPIKAGTILVLAAEKATINIREGDESIIQLKLLFTASHANRAVAEKELAYMKYMINQDEDRIELSNTFIFPREVNTLQSGLKVTFELTIPRTMRLEMRTRYCKVYLLDLSGPVEGTFEFGRIDIIRPVGKVKMKSYSTDVHAAFGLRTNSFQLDAKYGTVELEAHSIEELNFDFSTTEKSLVIPNDIRQRGEFGIHTFKSLDKKGKPKIRVTGLFTNIELSPLNP